MGICLKRFPEFGLELYIYAGAINQEEMFRHFRKLDPTAKWLSYFDPSADLTGVDLANLPALKSAITEKEYEKSGGEPRRHALVNVPGSRDLFARFWSVYAGAGVPIAHLREVFPTLDEACRWLDVPPAAHAAIVSAIEQALPRDQALTAPRDDDQPGAPPARP